MKRRAFAGLIAAMAAFGAASDAWAQTLLPLSFEGRIDAGIPIGDAGDLLSTGVGFGINAQLHLTPQFALYGGYSKFTFDFDDDIIEVDDVLDGDGDDVEEDGWQAGGKVFFGSGLGVSNPYIQVGALFRDDQTGLEAGAGWEYWVGGNLAVTPQATYRKIDDLEYIAAGVGARIRF